MGQEKSIATVNIERGSGITFSEVERAIGGAWQEVLDDPESFGLPTNVAAIGDVEVRQGESQFDVATTIMIAVVGGVAEEVLKTIWRDTVWPALQKRFGKGLKESSS